MARACRPRTSSWAPATKGARLRRLQTSCTANVLPYREPATIGVAIATLVRSSREQTMSLMQAQSERGPRYPTSTLLLKSSDDLGWSTLFAELCSYSQREGPGPVAPHAKISITVRGSEEGLVRCKVGGSWWSARPTTGSIWLKPMGGKYDEALSARRRFRSYTYPYLTSSLRA